MTVDPFAPASAATETAGSFEDASPVVSTPSDANYATAIIKAGAGYGAPSVSLRGADAADLRDQVKDNFQAIKELMTLVAQLGNGFAVVFEGDRPASAPQQRSSGNGRPAGATQPPAGFPPLPEGATYKTGVGKSNGKVWHAYDLADGKRQYVNQNKAGEYFLSDPK